MTSRLRGGLSHSFSGIMISTIVQVRRGLGIGAGDRGPGISGAGWRRRFFGTHVGRGRGALRFSCQTRMASGPLKGMRICFDGRSLKVR